MLQSAEGSLAEARSKNNKLSEELDEAQTILNKSQSVLTTRHRSSKRRSKPKLKEIRSYTKLL
jgi:hypothetical protein